MGWTCTLAGQSITAYTDELSVKILDSLAQGAGVMGGSTSRAATCTLITRLGPVGSAVGAGTTISTPQLVRGGEVKIYDATGTQVFGGYAMKLTDLTATTFRQVQMDVYDYWQHLDRVFINEGYGGGTTDVSMINALLAKYAPWINRSGITGNNYTFNAKVFRNISLQRAIQSIVDVTGFSFWVGYDKVAHYNSVVNSPSCSFNLSTSPDFSTTFDVDVQKYEVDDTAAINRCYFYGGHRLSNDYIQDLNHLADGKRTDFELLYYPHPALDGKFHAKLNNGKDLVMGYETGSSTVKTNTLKNNKGLADCLIDQNAHVLKFSSPPATNSHPTLRYRYEYPMLVRYIDRASYIFFGQYFDGALSDETVIDPAQAIARCKVVVGENSMGLTTIEAVTRKGGAKAGQLINLYHSVRGINQTFLIQQVEPIPYGGGQWKYKLTLGAWSWHLVDVIKHHAHMLMATDQSTEEVNATNAVTASHGSLFSFSTALRTGIPGTYYPRTVALHDGHDAYAGFSTINS